MSSTNIKVTSENKHQKVWNLLPWYINQSLDPAEQEFVKNHIKTCITCRIEIKQQQQLFEKIQQSDLLQQTSQVSFARLQKKIDQQSTPSLFAGFKAKKALQRQPGQFSRTLKYSMAASLLLLATPFMLKSPGIKPELQGEYRTLSNSTEGNSKHNIVRIIFAEQPDKEQIEAILNGVSGHIVKGPSKNGVYDVQIDNRKNNSQEAINNAISNLRSNSLVVFAESAEPLPVSD